MLLVQNGVPYQDALRMTATRRFAMIVAAGELKGGKFDWDRMEWDEKA